MYENMKTALEIEKKYIIKKPSIDDLRSYPEFTESEILQIYIQGGEGETHRVRRRIKGGVTVYTETIKRRVDKMSSTETEGEISKERFETLVETMLENTRPIVKRRYTFTYKSQMFEIDVYPEWEHTAILETELSSRDKQVEMPEIIRILKDVTGDKRYSNAGMSREFPEEIVCYL